MSRQYQRTSAQAEPPSAIMRSAGRRIPQIQQVLIAVDVSWAGINRSWSAMTGSLHDQPTAIPGCN